jgi:hypothetical protein
MRAPGTSALQGREDVRFIDRERVRPIMVRGRPVWGWTWRQAGFIAIGNTKGGLLAMRLPPEAMPEPVPAKPRSVIGLPLFGAAA